MESVPGRNVFDVATFACAPITELRCETCGRWVDVLWLGASEAHPVGTRCPVCILQGLSEGERPEWAFRVAQLRNARLELHLDFLNPWATLWAGTRGWEHHNTIQAGPDDPYAVFYNVIGVIKGEALADLSAFSEFPAAGNPQVGTLSDGQTPFTSVQVTLGWDIVHPNVPTAEICLRWNPNYPQNPPEMHIRNWREVSNAQLGLLVTEGMKAVRILNHGGAPRLDPADSLIEIQNYADWWKAHHEGAPAKIEDFCDLVPGCPTPDKLKRRISAAGRGTWKNYKAHFLTRPKKTRSRR